MNIISLRACRLNNIGLWRCLIVRAHNYNGGGVYVDGSPFGEWRATINIFSGYLNTGT